MKLTAVILTLNEARHLPRCLGSIADLVDVTVVVDCYSSDNTVDIARQYGALVLQRDWVNYASQFNWALNQLYPDTEWVLRIDADEYLTPALAAEVRERLPGLAPEIDGVTVGRRMTFQGRLIRFGGLFPVRVLRLFRHGRGECENRWMDEHIKVSGPTVHFEGELIDDSKQTLSEWIDKHNTYASREAIDLLNLEFGFTPHDTVARLQRGNEAGFKRWIKESVYLRLPGGLRAFIYFLYRYVLRLGFLDGWAGTTFHVLHGFWYRYLVDAKVEEVKRHMQRNKISIVRAIDESLGIRVLDSGAFSVADGQ